MECPKCKIEIQNNSKFCNECGCHLVEGLDLAENTCVMDSERKLVTVMFSDMSGYTAMTERLDPEEVKGIMSHIFGKVTEIIRNYDGFIEKFIGDAVMAVFGVPKSHEDDPIRAIRAALEIHSAVEGFSPQFEDKIGRSLKMHTGINTGLVVTGEVDIAKGTHGLTGDAINLASRIEGLAQSGEILVGEDTYQLSKGHFKFESMEQTQVKGKAEPVPVYKVVSALDQQIITKSLQGVQAELIGRETEMNMLIEAVENLKKGKGSIFSIVGYAGTGKSRLVRELKSRINRDKVQWREGHAYAYTQNMAYYPLTNLLTYAFQVREGDNPDQIKKKIESGVQELLWDKPDAKKYLGGLFSLSYAELDEMSPEFWQNQLYQSVQQLLEAFASRGPTVILFEDLHWADKSFMKLLYLLLENIQRPVMFLCVYRPSFNLFPDRIPDSLVWPHHKIDIGDMSWDQAQAMLQSLLDSSDLPDELRYYIKQKVEGNPFYLEEVVNSLIERGILTSDNGSWRLTQELSLAVIPTTIQGVLTARLDRLEKEAKRILQEASVIGRAFFYEVLTRVTELTIPVDKCLLGLESLDLIRARSSEPDLEYIFKHALTQEVAYNGILKKERLEIHERIGLVMEQVFQNRTHEFYETLAYHFSRGKSTLKAVHYLVKSGEKCLNRFAVEESHRYFEQAYDILSNKSDKTKMELETYIDLINRWAMVFYYRGDFKGLVRLYAANDDLAKSLNHKKLLGMFYAWFGFAKLNQGDPKGSYEYLHEALKLGEEIDDCQLVGYACCWLSWSCGALGLSKEGKKNGARALRVSKMIESDHYLYFKTLGGIAFVSYLMGDYKKPFETGKLLLEYGKRHSNIRSMVIGHLNIGLGELASGDYIGAINCFKKAILVSKDPYYREYSRLYLGLSYLFCENYDKAELELVTVYNASFKMGFEKVWGVLTEALLGLVAVTKGDLARGIKAIDMGRSKCRELGALPYYAMLEYILGKVYLKMIQNEGPLNLSFLAKNIGFLVRNLPFARQKAEKHFFTTIEIAKKFDGKGFIGQAYLDLGLMYKLKKRNKQSKQFLFKAIQIFEETNAKKFLNQAKDAMESIE